MGVAKKDNRDSNDVVRVEDSENDLTSCVASSYFRSFSLVCQDEASGKGETLRSYS